MKVTGEASERKTYRQRLERRIRDWYEATFLVDEDDLA